MSSGRLFNSAFATFILPCYSSFLYYLHQQINMSNRLCYSSGTMCQGHQLKATNLKRYHGHPDTPPIWTELLNAAQNIQRNFRNRVLWSVLSPVPVVEGYLRVKSIRRHKPMCPPSFVWIRPQLFKISCLANPLMLKNHFKKIYLPDSDLHQNLNS